jgi:hypothetical protein
LDKAVGFGLGALSIFSDERMKEDVEKVGELNNDLPVYKYRYKGEPTTQIGLMAQDVEEKNPAAVSTHPSGMKMVDYGRATQPMPTKLSSVEEAKFKAWAKQNGVRMDPGWNEDYDMRGYWKANPSGRPDSRGHYPDTFKLPNHPTFSNESRYATPDAPHWVGHKLIDKNGRVIADETPTSGGGKAMGGMVTEPTMAMIGESGPEMVVPMSDEPGAILPPSTALRYGQPAPFNTAPPPTRPRAAYSQQYRYVG